MSVPGEKFWRLAKRVLIFSSLSFHFKESEVRLFVYGQKADILGV